MSMHASALGWVDWALLAVLFDFLLRQLRKRAFHWAEPGR